MKNLFVILLVIIISLSAQIDNGISSQSVNNRKQPDKLNQLFDEKGMTKNKVESLINNSELENNLIDKNNIDPEYDIIELDGVRYLKDGLKYIPIYEDGVSSEDPSQENLNLI